MNMPQIDPVPARIARQALDDMPLAERRRLMNLHMQGYDSTPLLQNHLENEIEEFQQKIAEFSVRTLENMRRIALVSSKLAQDLEALEYLESIEIQIKTLSEAIRDLKPVEQDLFQTVQTAAERLKQRNAKIQELTLILNTLKNRLSSASGRQTATTKGIYSVGDNVSRYIVGLDYAPSPSNRNVVGGPDIFKIK